MKTAVFLILGISLTYASNLNPSIEGAMEPDSGQSIRRNPKLYWGVSKFLFNGKLSSNLIIPFRQQPPQHHLHILIVIPLRDHQQQLAIERKER